MYRLIAIILLVGLFFSATTYSKAPAKPMKGRVASFTDIVVMGGDGTVDKVKATEMAEKGQPIVFVVGAGKSAKIYFVFNEDGTYGGKNLAKYANNKFVGIIGKTKKVNGINIIIASQIESMD